MVYYLIGFMGSGKSTVGRKLAKRLHYDFFDTDRMIEERFNLPEYEVVKKYGLSLYQQTEVEIIRELQSLKDGVVSCGGDLPCHGDNLEDINRQGISIYIQMSPKSLAIRLFNARKKRAQIEQYLQNLETLEHFVENNLQHHEQYFSQAHLQMKGENLQIDHLVRLISENCNDKLK